MSEEIAMEIVGALKGIKWMLFLLTLWSAARLGIALAKRH